MSGDVDLFGDPITQKQVMARPSRVGINGRGFKGGYYTHPGSGPAGETCKTCKHYCRVAGGRKAYPKCERMRHHWSHGPGSDIKAKAPACSGWETKA